MRKTCILNRDQFEDLIIGSSVLERNIRGLKVLRLQGGDVMKIFRVKNIFSSARIYSYASRFCRNAERLQKISIPTVRIKQLSRIQGTTDAVVIYTPLEGKTLRELLDSRALTILEAQKLGQFVAYLHRNGVHFRSLHPGNIVLDSRNVFGLIDIADMSIYPWRLWCNTRIRSFKHFYRYPEYIRKMGPVIWNCIETTYFRHSQLSFICEYILRHQLKKLSTSAIH